DTNQRNLFSDDYRFDSHGCSRVDNVRDLAAWLLQEEMPKWNRAAIDAAIATGQREAIALPKKVPVAWVYLTAWMTRDQTIQIRNDIYDQDEQLLEATAEEAAFFNKAANHPLTAHLVQYRAAKAPVARGSRRRRCATAIRGMTMRWGTLRTASIN